MTPDSSATAALLIFAAVAAGVMAWEFRRSGLDFGAWFLYVAERLYVATWFHWRANRRCPFPEQGPAIIVANHRSPVDPLLIWMNNHLGSRKRPVRVIGFMTAREYYEIPGLAWICRTMQSIPVERDGKDVKPVRAALERLKQGHLLGVFPEGGINTEEGVREGDTGIAWLALHARVPIYPVYLHGSPVDVSMVRPFFKRSRVRVAYGDPIDISAYYGCKKTRAVLSEVTDLLMRRLAELGGVQYAKDVVARPDRKSGWDTTKSVRSTG